MRIRIRIIWGGAPHKAPDKVLTLSTRCKAPCADKAKGAALSRRVEKHTGNA